jgi:phage tail-like protein
MRFSADGIASGMGGHVGVAATNQQADPYPLPAFYFKVVFAGLTGNTDTSFQEVQGIGSDIETEEIQEGGENRYVHRSPKAVKHSQLELRRGIASLDSPVVRWCRDTLESGSNQAIRTALVTVSLLNAEGDPVRAWSFVNAYPVKWEIDDFKSTGNYVAIETIVLNYAYSSRTI